jgi:beta-lactamase class A
MSRFVQQQVQLKSQRSSGRIRNLYREAHGLKHRSRKTILRSAALLFILIAVGISVFQYSRYKQSADVLPDGSAWGGVDVGGLSRADAYGRIQAVYSRMVELRYQGAAIHASTKDLGLNVKPMPEGSYHPEQSFWDYLWNNPASALDIHLELEIDQNTLRTYLTEQVAARYDRFPAAPRPLADSTRFEIGQSGSRLDVEASIEKIQAQIHSSEINPIDLVVHDLPAAAPDLENLEIFLKQKIDQAGFNGIAEISMVDLKDERALHFAYRAGLDLPENIAFSAASTIKIPILVSALRRVTEPVPAEVDNLIVRMMALSENPPADQLMSQVIGGELAPLSVTDDMQKLGLQDTFLAGYFYLGAPLLQLYETPANTRQDVTTSPDIYNQTTAGDMTVLMQAIYQCAKENSGLLVNTFPGDMTQAKCETLLKVMAQNKIGVLFEAGVPDGTVVAHKHGWTEESDGYLHSISDIGVIYAKETDYLLIVFLYDTNQLLFDPANRLMAQLSQVVYNYFNPNNQIDWLFGPIGYR